MIKLIKTDVNYGTNNIGFMFPFNVIMCKNITALPSGELIKVLQDSIEIQNAIFEQILPEKNRPKHSRIYINPIRYAGNEDFIDNYANILASFFEIIYLLEYQNTIYGYYVVGLKNESVEIFNSLFKKNMLNKYIRLFTENFEYSEYTEFELFRVFIESKDKSNDSDVSDDYIKYLKQNVSNIKCVPLHLFGWGTEEIENNSLLKHLFCQFNNVYILFANGRSAGAYLT